MRIAHRHVHRTKLAVEAPAKMGSSLCQPTHTPLRWQAGRAIRYKSAHPHSHALRAFRFYPLPIYSN